jgi:Ca2+/Na+ antiporter
MEELTELSAATATMTMDAGFGNLLLHFFINTLVVAFIIHFFYYKKSHRRDYYFTFILISISIFMMIFLLGDVKIKVGFALGLFAIFGIIRYRTESMPVREMTYLFAIISISVINALVVNLSYLEQAGANIIFILSFWLCESNHWLKHISEKLVQYDRIDLILPGKREELISDLQKRTGLHILRIEVGHIDFIHDSAILKIFYEPEGDEINTTDLLPKMPRQ